jgi:hypothetical protein
MEFSSISAQWRLVLLLRQLLLVDGCTDPRKSGAECLNWWGDIGRREALAERHVCDCWIGDGVLSGAMRRCGAFAA